MKRKTLTQGERADFAQFCKNATDAQVENIRRKELDARRFDYAEIALEEMKRRGLA